MINLKTILAILALSVGVVSCIPNDIPYPNQIAEITAFKVAGQLEEPVIDKKTLEVRVKLADTTNVKKVRVLKLDITDSTTMTPSVGEFLDMRQPVELTLTKYRDYNWRIIAEWSVERLVVATTQMEESLIDPINHTVIVYVSKTTLLNSVVFETFKLGPSNSVTLPDAMAGPQDLSGAGKKFVVSYHDQVEEWTVKALHSTVSVVTKGAVGWAKLATLTGSMPKSYTDPTFRYKKTSETQWTTVPLSDVTLDANGTSFSATIKGLEPSTDYVAQAASGTEFGAELPFTTDAAATIPNLNFEDWTSTTAGSGITVWYPYAQGGSKFWTTGNAGVAAVNKQSNTTPVTGADAYRGTAVKLTSINGIPIFKFAAGNLFTGEFATNVTAPLESPKFGRPFVGRPSKLKGYYKYTSKTIDTQYTGYMPESKLGEADQCHIWISLEYWPTQESGSSNGISWIKRPEDRTVIGYGELRSADNVSDYKEFIIDIKYKNTELKPNFIVVVATSSSYGDKFVGGAGSTLYVDEFSFDYDSDPTIEIK